MSFILILLGFVLVIGVLFKINDILESKQREQESSEHFWHYRLNDKNIGPISRREIDMLVDKGVITHDTFLWKIGWQNWKSARQIYPEKYITTPPSPPRLPNQPPPPFPNPDIDQSVCINPKTGLAIASLVCGIVGSIFSITSIPAVICGHVALVQIKNNPVNYGGKGMAIAGLVLGYIAIVLGIVLGTLKGILWAQLLQMGY